MTYPYIKQSMSGGKGEQCENWREKSKRITFGKQHKENGKEKKFNKIRKHEKEKMRDNMKVI